MSCRKEESKGGGEEDDDGVVLCSSSSRGGNDGIHLQQKEEEEEDEILVGGGRKRNRVAKAKHLLLLPLKNFQTLHFTKKKHRRRPDPPPPPPPPTSLPPFPYAEEGLKGCYLCFMPPQIPASASSPLPSTIQKKPSSSYYDFVKSLIEENDFYSPECNVHRDLMSPERK